MCMSLSGANPRHSLWLAITPATNVPCPKPSSVVSSSVQLVMSTTLRKCGWFFRKPVLKNRNSNSSAYLRWWETKPRNQWRISPKGNVRWIVRALESGHEDASWLQNLNPAPLLRKIWCAFFLFDYPWGSFHGLLCEWIPYFEENQSIPSLVLRKRTWGLAFTNLKVRSRWIQSCCSRPSNVRRNRGF